MIFRRIFNVISGYVKISISGYFIERFINLLSNLKVPVWGMKRTGKAEILLCIPARDFKKARIPARKTGSRVKIQKKYGLPFLIYKYRKRKGMVLGLLIFFLLIFYMSAFLWSVEVTGNKTVERSEIIGLLEKEGFKPGKFSLSFDLHKLEYDILAHFPQIIWTHIGIHGSKAIVEVKEGRSPPPIVPQSEPCNIVAAADGVVTSIVVYRGDAKVKEGEAVSKGQLLVSGVLDSSITGMRLVHAAADITGQLRYTLETKHSLSQKERLSTGASLTRQWVSVFTLNIPLFWKKEIPYTLYETEDYTKELSIWKGFVLPIKHRRITYKEQKEEVVNYSVDDAVKAAMSLLYAEEKKTFNSLDIEYADRSTCLHERIVTAKGEYLCKGQLAIQEPIILE